MKKEKEIEESKILNIDESVAPEKNLKIDVIDEATKKIDEKVEPIVIDVVDKDKSKVEIYESKEAEERAKLKESLRAEISKENIRNEIGKKVKNKKKYIIIGSIFLLLTLVMVVIIFSSSTIFKESFSSVNEIKDAEGLALFFLWIFMIPVMFLVLGMYFIPFFGFSITAFFLFAAGIRKSTKGTKTWSILLMLLTVFVQIGTLIGIVAMVA